LERQQLLARILEEAYQQLATVCGSELAPQTSLVGMARAIGRMQRFSGVSKREKFHDTQQ
jgi:hypothetical protein